MFIAILLRNIFAKIISLRSITVQSLFSQYFFQGFASPRNILAKLNFAISLGILFMEIATLDTIKWIQSKSNSKVHVLKKLLSDLK